ncbi:MAG: hypothetical protein IKP64_14335, partial [Selenomonadaceae bacterium]|nr:hypothetical protein [Selenomonadaceae bacterium]
MKAQYDAKRARLEQIKSLNEQIAAAQKQKDEIRTDAKKARESNDEATSADLRQQYQNVNEQQKQTQAELDDLLFEPANDEVAEAVAKLNAEIRELENQIAKSNSRDEKKSLTEKLTAKKNRLKNILDANQKVIATRKKLAITDQNGDSSNYAEAFSANEQAEKELDKYLNPPAPKEKKPAKAKTEKKSAETTSPTPEQSQSTPKKIKPKPPAQESTQPAPKTETQPETQPETKSEPQKSAQRDEEYTTDDGRIFSSLEDSERNLKEAFADFAPAKFNDEETAEKDDEIPADKFINVVDDSDEANEKDIAELHKELRKMSAMPMFNPKVWTLGLRIGIRYLQRGINNFVAWAKKMTQDVGEEFEPWQKALWETLKTMPAIKKFNDKQIWSIADRIGSLYENGTTELEDIEKDFAEKLGEETTKAITPMIRATYKGIQKFFADRQKESESQPQTEEKAPDNKKAAVTVTGDEFGEYDGIDDLRKKAIQYYSENLQGTSVENETLGKIDIDENGLINFTGSGKRELKNSSAKINKLLLVKYLPELIRNSTDITGKDSTKDRHKGDYFYYLHTNAQVNDKTIPVEITVVKRNNGEIQYYNHTLPSEEKAKDAVVSTEPESSNEALGTLSIPASSAEDKTSDENIPQNAQSNKDENTTNLESTRKQLRAEAEAKAAKPKSDEQANESQSTKAEQSEIVYPDGALTYGDKTAVEKFKRGYSDKNFDTNNDKKVTVDGREMTRLEVVEGIAKGELDESALKLHKREREYLEWLQKNLLAPLKKIQQAGIQNEQAETHISARWSAHDTVYFEGIEKHAKTLSALSKLAESLGGEVNKNSQGNTSFKFAIPKIGAEFARAAEFFMENVHLPYFGQERVIKNPLAELKNISLPEGVKILKIDIAPNSKGVWRVKFVGKFPANKEPAAFNRKQAETNRLFADLAKHFNGRLYADSTYHFKNKSDAMEFKKALDEHLGLKVTAGTFADNPDLIFNSDAITRTADNAIKTDKEIKSLNDIVDLTRDTNAFVDMVKKVQSLGKEVTAKLKDGTLTRAEAEEIAGDLTDEFENARKQFDAGKITQTEAQDKMRAVV